MCVLYIEGRHKIVFKKGSCCLKHLKTASFVEGIPELTLDQILTSEHFHPQGTTSMLQETSLTEASSWVTGDNLTRPGWG